MVECPTCHGLGNIYVEKCHKCSGSGAVKQQQNVTIEVPAGISNGQTISLRGQGESGERGSDNGDLYVNVHVASHKKFQREGNNILSSEEINFSQAVLGDKITVETIEGNLTMKIPSGTQSGEIFRIKNKGVPILGRNGRGDQMVRVIIKTPKSVNREQKNIIEKLQENGL